MLHFIYMDTLVEDEIVVASGSPVSSVSDTLAAKLLAVADKYGLERLRVMCESYLCEVISVNTVASTLALADRYHAMELKAACLKFAAENLAGIYLFSFQHPYLYSLSQICSRGTCIMCVCVCVYPNSF